MPFGDPRHGATGASSTHRRSLVSLEADPNERLFNTLMSDPVKRDLVLKFLSKEKPNIDKYLKGKTAKSPHLKRIKVGAQNNSPSALLRKRMLEKKPQDIDTGSTSSSDSDVVSSSCSPVPFEILLNGVVAFVEVRSVNGDRSSGFKAIMRTMGAEISDTFTRAVTHVIFKVRY